MILDSLDKFNKRIDLLGTTQRLSPNMSYIQTHGRNFIKDLSELKKLKDPGFTDAIDKSIRFIEEVIKHQPSNFENNISTFKEYFNKVFRRDYLENMLRQVDKFKNDKLDDEEKKVVHIQDYMNR